MSGKSDSKLNYPRDVNGRQILPGDTIKIYHFTGVRGKKHYMYKFVTGVNDRGRLEVSHLNLDGSGYTLGMNGDRLENYEIIQGYYGGMPFTARRKVA